MSSSGSIRITVIVSLLLHAVMVLAVLLTMSGGLDLPRIGEPRSHMQVTPLSRAVNSESIPEPGLKAALNPAPKAKTQPKPVLEAKALIEPSLKSKAELQAETKKDAKPISTGEMPLAEQQAQNFGLENEKIQAYKRHVSALIEAQKYYPRRLQKMRNEGRVEVEFTLQQNGTLVMSRVLSHQGHRLFRKAALAALERVDHFPQFPEGLKRSSWTFTVGLEYQLTI